MPASPGGTGCARGVASASLRPCLSRPTAAGPACPLPPLPRTICFASLAGLRPCGGRGKGAAAGCSAPLPREQAGAHTRLSHKIRLSRRRPAGRPAKTRPSSSSATHSPPQRHSRFRLFTFRRCPIERGPTPARPLCGCRSHDNRRSGGDAARSRHRTVCSIRDDERRQRDPTTPEKSDDAAVANSSRTSEGSKGKLFSQEQCQPFSEKSSAFPIRSSSDPHRE